MSIYFDFEVGSSGRRFRRAVAEDKNDIEVFVDQKHAEQLFGEVDVGALITQTNKPNSSNKNPPSSRTRFCSIINSYCSACDERCFMAFFYILGYVTKLKELSVLPICMINSNREVVGFMALNDYPNVIGLDPADWEMWMRNIFQKFYVARNTLFIHFMCCMESVLEYFLEEACISVFRNDVYLQHIVLLSACEAEHAARYQIFKKKFMYRFNARRIDDSESTPHVMHVALRQDYCPKLKIRRAVEEDNDDIVELLDQKCPRLKELYGNYYISEIIGRHPESKRKIIVPEFQDHAVGVMCLNTEINYGNLQRLYELQPYHGLMKATPLEKEQMKRSNALLDTFGIPIMLGQCGPFDFPTYTIERDSFSDPYLTQNKDKHSQSKRESQQKSFKVNFKHGKRTRIMDSVHTKMPNTDQLQKKELISPTASQMSYKSIETLILDDDPFDYEIVNIDKSLLSLSEAFSCEFLLGNKSGQSSMQSVASTVASVCKTKKRKSILLKRERKDSIIPILNGLPNAFLIELFELGEDVDEINSIDMLEVAFEIMKDYDYCIIHVPAAERPLNLLQHFTFVPVRQKRCSDFSLYIAHRSSVIGKLRVRRAEVLDIPSIANFLQNIDAAETISMIEHSFSGDTYEAFVFMSGLSVVGVGILEPPEQLHFIRAKYNMDPFHNHKYHLSSPGIKSGFATVKIILIYPVFEVHYRYFAREMMRQSGSNTLIWMTAYRSKLMAHKSNTLISAMVPLRPRKFEIDYSKIPELSKVAAVAKGMLPFCTWFLDKKLTSVPIVNVSTRILIVGASRTSLSFLDALLFDKASSYLRFNNITLISTHGLPYTRNTSAAVEMMFPKHYSISEKYLKCIPYTYYVNTITGTVIEINKQEKYVMLTSGHKCYYDLLFLFFGKQYQHPDYLNPIVEMSMKCTEKSPYRRLDVPNQYVEPDYISYDTPSNVFIINYLQEARKALKYVRHLLTEGFDFKVAVYGATIHAYCCLTALLEMNVAPDNIIFIDPFPPLSKDKPRISVFSNSNVDETICEVLSSLGVEIYRSYYFQSWAVSDGLVTNVQFLSRHQFVSVECNAFFYYGKRGVNTQAFLAVNKSGMAYDGGILIDHQCRTKDPSIYAAGPSTAYNSRYFGASKRHKYYDSEEIGAKLGEQIRNQLDPLFCDNSDRKHSVQFCKDISNHPTGPKTEDDESTTAKCAAMSSVLNKEPARPSDMLPHFEKPKVRYCKLPGGLQYLEVRSPGKKIPHHYVQSLHYRGVIMETFKSGYFKLHMNNELVVDGVTCLTYEKYALENFRNLYGKSSVILNNVYLRYTTKKLDDLFEFFRSPWACFLYHDQTDELFNMVKELYPKFGNNMGCTLAEALESVVEVIKDKENRVRMRKKFEPSPYIESVTNYVIDWISQNDILLPMYLQPCERNEFLHDMERDPLFAKRRMNLTSLIKQILCKHKIYSYRYHHRHIDKSHGLTK